MMREIEGPRAAGFPFTRQAARRALSPALFCLVRGSQLPALRGATVPMPHLRVPALQRREGRPNRVRRRVAVVNTPGDGRTTFAGYCAELGDTDEHRALASASIAPRAHGIRQRGRSGEGQVADLSLAVHRLKLLSQKRFYTRNEAPLQGKSPSPT